MALGRLPEVDHELAQAAATALEADGILINRSSMLADLGRHDEAVAASPARHVLAACRSSTPTACRASR